MKKILSLVLALLMVLLIVFLLPRMHERYFYMALPLAAAYAARRGAKAVCALVYDPHIYKNSFSSI